MLMTKKIERENGKGVIVITDENGTTYIPGDVGTTKDLQMKGRDARFFSVRDIAIVLEDALEIKSEGGDK